MTPKERAAMQQALEALEVYGEHAKDCPQYPTYTRPQDYPKCDCGFEEAIAALREALAEQAEQEPVAWGRIFDGDIIDCICPEEHALNEGDYTVPLYAAPVRTKDLTDDEIDEIWTQTPWSEFFHFARAVIAADRKKNK